MSTNNTKSHHNTDTPEEYLTWIRTIYPVDKLNISDEHGNPVTLVRTTNIRPFDESEKDRLIYYICEIDSPSKTVQLPATIQVFPKEKRLNFLVEREHSGKGYGRTIYNNVQAILETLGVEDRENYSITVAYQKDHPFLQYMRAQDLLKLTNQEQNAINATSLLAKLSSHPHELSLAIVNSIIEYARNSGLPDADISNALNANHFNITPSSIEDDNLKRFRSFNLPGLQATNMHQTIMNYRSSNLSASLRHLLLISPNDKNGISDEFSRILADVETLINDGTIKESSLPDTISPSEKSLYHVFGWYSIQLVLQNLTAKMQSKIKSQAIGMIDLLDPKRDYCTLPDPATLKIAQTLIYMPLAKEDYIAMYMKFLNRNFTLPDFQRFHSTYGIFDAQTIAEASAEIRENTYYPAPKNNWSRIPPQKLGFAPRRKVIPLPTQKLPTDLKSIRNKIKTYIQQDGTAKKTKIKTDMTGTNAKGKEFKVTNLHDWLFGVPGTNGYLKISEFKSGPHIILPPQTPNEAVILIQNILQEKFHSHPDDYENR